jgi:23S rRNA pseudouridine1911/1915/1917 synthase
LKKLFEDGSVLCDGKALKASTKLRAGSLISISFPAPAPSEVLPEALALEVLFEDEHLLVINKPQGLTVHPSPTKLQGTLVGALLHRGGALSRVGGPMRPGIVHRLDKDTSGALVISKTDECHRKLTEIFSRHEIDRTYWALCYGTPEKRAGEIESTLGRNPADRKKMAMNVKGGRKARTLYKRLEEYGQARAKPFASWLELTLHTGRTHQIRVHLTGLGCSVLGDPVYGTPSSKQPKWLALPANLREAVESLPGQALHARTLGFVHPMTGKKVAFTAEPPAAFRELLALLTHVSC